MVKYMKQIWWHITDSYDTEPTQSMRQVMDFITNENEFPIILPFLQSATSGNEGRKNGNFYGLRVFARNSQLRELGYIWHENCALCNIDLDAFPKPSSSFLIKETDPEAALYRHVKMEVEYTIPKPAIVNYYGDPELVKMINFCFSPKKKVFMQIKGQQIQPELTITLPKGWILSRRPRSRTCRFAIKCYVAYTNPEGSTHKLSNEDDAKVGEYQIRCHSASENVNGHWRYSLLFEFPDDYYKEDSKEFSFELNYISAISWDAFLLSTVLPFMFIIASSLISTFAILKWVFPISLDLSVFLTLAGMLLSFVFVYVSYYQNGYHLTRPHGFIISVMATVATVIIGLLQCNA